MQEVIVHVARSWLGTPFHLHGRVKNVGCDCLGLIIGISLELNLKDKFNTRITTLDDNTYHHIYDGNKLKVILDEHFNKSEEINLGDLALFSFDNNSQHLGIIGGYRSSMHSIIHSDLRVGMVVEHRLCGVLKRNLIQSYKFNY